MVATAPVRGHSQVQVVSTAASACVANLAEILNVHSWAGARVSRSVCSVAIEVVKNFCHIRCTCDRKPDASEAESKRVFQSSCICPYPCIRHSLVTGGSETSAQLVRRISGQLLQTCVCSAMLLSALITLNSLVCFST